MMNTRDKVKKIWVSPQILVEIDTLNTNLFNLLEVGSLKKEKNQIMLYI